MVLARDQLVDAVVDKEFGPEVPVAGIDRLGISFLDFREVRAGLGADVKLAEKWSLALEAGAVTDRKFDYFDRNYSLNGDAGWYGTLFLRTSF